MSEAQKEPAETGSLGSQAVRGMAWLGSGQMLRQGLGVLTTAVLARLLTPDDFGLFGMTYLAAEAAQILTAFGFGAAIVQRQEASAQVLSSCFWANLALGVAAGLVLLACGPLLVIYFRRPEIQGLLLPLALNMLLSAAWVVPQALLTQRLQFRSMIVAQTLGSVAAAGAAVGAAWWGAGYWSLAVQPLVGTLVTGLLMMRASRWLPSKALNWASLRDLMDFSTKLLGNNLVGYIGRNMPSFVLGRQLGAAPLALYSLASHLTGAVLYQISSVVVRVLFPTLSAMQNDMVRLRSAWLRATAGIAALTLPLMFGASVMATEVVHLLLGAQWSGAAGPLSVLALSMAAQSVLTTSGTVLMSLGKAGALLRLSIVTTLLLGFALVAGARWGVTAAAIAYTAVNISSCLVSTGMACRASGTPLRAFAAAMAPWLLASAGSAAVIYAVMQVLPTQVAVLRLLVAAGVGGLVYAALLLLLAKEQVTELLGSIWQHLRKR